MTLKRASDIAYWFAEKNKDPKETAKLYYPMEYRKMMRVFRQSCYTFTEEDVELWESLIKTLITQERKTRKAYRDWETDRKSVV